MIALRRACDVYVDPVVSLVEAIIGTTLLLTVPVCATFTNRPLASLGVIDRLGCTGQTGRHRGEHH